MRNFKILHSAMQIRRASVPVGKNFQVIKLSEEQAIRFGLTEVTFDRMVQNYGSSVVLKENEFYDGYVAVFRGRYAEVVRMKGQLERVAREVACTVLDYEFAERILKGEAWTVVYPYRKEKMNGTFNYYHEFGGMALTRAIRDWQMQGKFLDVDPTEMDLLLKDKLIAALLTDRKIVRLEEVEKDILRNYLGNYFDRFLVEI